MVDQRDRSAMDCHYNSIHNFLAVFCGLQKTEKLEALKALIHILDCDEIQSVLEIANSKIFSMKVDQEQENNRSKESSQQPKLVMSQAALRHSDKLFTCKVCRKSFTDSGNLSRHKRIHSGQKPYTCNYCGKAFSDKGNYNRHVQTHSTERTFECPHCTKKFADKSNLNRHTQTHTGEKHHRCRYCHKTFSRSEGLQRHVKQIHPGLRHDEDHGVFDGQGIEVAGYDANDVQTDQHMEASDVSKQGLQEEFVSDNHFVKEEMKFS